jgi:hypothetical protein
MIYAHIDTDYRNHKSYTCTFTSKSQNHSSRRDSRTLYAYLWFHLYLDCLTTQFQLRKLRASKDWLIWSWGVKSHEFWNVISSHVRIKDERVLWSASGRIAIQSRGTWTWSLLNIYTDGDYHDQTAVTSRTSDSQCGQALASHGDSTRSIPSGTGTAPLLPLVTTIHPVFHIYLSINNKNLDTGIGSIMKARKKPATR